ncbi:uncharacterized protein BT62DRAFT_191293 [Guyanagaster necrorhizus]|uniref:Uncharacterized protein n=1 Tax=Guyanagaster necrorhizus TaxID=856835 RepID=A0A9P7VRY2_9AGAR|nr:uncharacterized protein BT62DRAFT_191293 [Guyanagaster necrorhizus MCA 3950]KAG7445365.1 hypothetical protein BT62DRAFT_191293 [Guyanagaster necrorhizus MCA 3950]
MLLLDKDDKGSDRASLLALDASSSTGTPTVVGVPPPLVPRLSRRLFLIHLLHLLLLAISLTILIAGVLRLEENVSVSFANVGRRIPPFSPPGSRASQAAPVSSYLSLGFQIFFTAAVIILAYLSRVAAVDSAIRHRTWLPCIQFLSLFECSDESRRTQPSHPSMEWHSILPIKLENQLTTVFEPIQLCLHNYSPVLYRCSMFLCRHVKRSRYVGSFAPGA